jgi:hypothetical protein
MELIEGCGMALRDGCGIALNVGVPTAVSPVDELSDPAVLAPVFTVVPVLPAGIAALPTRPLLLVNDPPVVVLEGAVELFVNDPPVVVLEGAVELLVCAKEITGAKRMGSVISAAIAVFMNRIG